MKASATAVLIILLVILFLPSFGQNRYKSLKVGDYLPDIKLENILNYSKANANISDFGNKLLIIDFWATWCSPCIASFSKLDSLQRKFGSNVQILPVTSESKEKVKDLFDKISLLKGLHLLSVTNDSVLSSLFKHSVLPHYVWVDKNRKVIAITESEDVQERNINLALNGKPFNYRLKNDYKTWVVTSPEIFSPGIYVKNGDSSIRFKKMDDSLVILHSTLTKYVEGATNGVISLGNPTSISLKNTSISWLYRIALMQNDIAIVNSSSLLVEIPDPNLYTHITSNVDGKSLTGLKGETWIRENGYCYELRVPPTLISEKYNLMLNDLNTYFGALFNIKGVLETRNSNCLVLKRIDSVDRLLTKGGISGIKKTKFSLSINNKSVKSLLAELAVPLQTHSKLIDETNYTGNIDLELVCSLSDLESLNKELGKYGLQLIEMEREISVAVIRMKEE